MKRWCAGFLVAMVAITGSLVWAQMAKPRKAVARTDTSKAHDWAEAVTDFITSKRILETFRTADVRERFKVLVPPEALVVYGPGIGEDAGESFLGNQTKGVSRLDYTLSEEGDGLSQIGWVTIYMPKTDPDGIDVLSRVVASMKRKLRPPWVPIHKPGYAYYWHQTEALLSATVDTVDNMPDTNGGEPTGRSIRGSWVWVNFGHVPGFAFPASAATSEATSGCAG